MNKMIKTKIIKINGVKTKVILPKGMKSKDLAKQQDGKRKWYVTQNIVSIIQTMKIIDVLSMKKMG